MIQIDLRLRASILIFALSAPILAATTFAYVNGGSVLLQFSRNFSSPVTIIEILVVGLAMLGGLSPTAQMSDAPRWSQISLIILLAIAISTTALATADPLAAIVRTAAWGVHLAFGLSIYGMTKQCADRTIVSLIWPAMMLGLIVFTIGLIMFVALIPSPGEFKWVEFYYGVINIRQLGFYSAAGFAIALGLIICQGNKYHLMLTMMCGSIFAALTFWSGTRSSLIAIGFGIACLFPVLSVRLWLRNLGLALVMLICGAMLSVLHRAPVAYMGIRRIFDDSVSDNLNTVTNGRVDIWIGTVKMILKQPFFGYGESQFRGIVPENQNLFNHPHNSLLQICFQWGLVGGACFFALFVGLWWHVFQVTRTRPEIGTPAFLVIASLFGLSLIEGSLYHTWPVAMMAFAAAVAIGGPRALDPR